MTLNEIADYIRSNVTLHFDQFADGTHLYSNTSIGCYDIIYTCDRYRIRTPSDTYYKGVHNDLASAMDACIEHHRNALIRAIENGSKK